MLNNKWRPFLFFTLGLVFLIGFNGYYRYVEGLSVSVEALISEKLRADSIFIVENLKSQTVEGKVLEESPFIIEIFEGDSVKYWNNQSSQASSSDYNIVSQWSVSRYFVKIGLNYESFGASPWAQKNNITISKPSSEVNDFLFLNSVHLKGHTRPSKIHVFLRGLSWILLFLGLISLIISFWRHANNDALGYKNEFLLSLVLSLIFKGLHYWPFWNSLFEGFVGFTSINQTSFFTPNLVHLIMNIWMFIILIFRGQNLIESTKVSVGKGGLKSFLYGVFVTSVFVYFTYLTQGFVLDSEVNLDVDALMEFNHISFVLVVCFIIYVITIFHGSVIGDKILKKNGIKGITFLAYTFLGIVSSLLFYQFIEVLQVPWLMFLIFIVAFILMIDAYVESRERKVTYLIWWLFIFSGFIATVLFYFGLQKDVEERKFFVENYYSQPVDSLVRGMMEIQDSLVASNFFNTVSQTERTAILDYPDIKEYIQNILPEKFQSWPIIIELYDKNSGKSLFTNHFSDFYRTKSSFENGINRGKGVVFNPFENKYLRRFEIALSSTPNNSWYLFLILNSENKDKKNLQHQNYDFAIIQDEAIVFKQEINYPIGDENLIKLASETKVQSGYSMVVSYPEGNYKIVSWKKISGLIKPISLFSFIFTVAGLILLVLSVFNTKYEFLPDSLALKMGARTSLKAKIQWAIIGLILFAFFIIGVITVFYFKNMLEVQENSRYKEENNSIYNNIRSLTQNLSDEEYALSFLINKLKDISYIHDKDVTLYDSQGQLVSSTSELSNFIRMPFENWSNETRRTTTKRKAQNPQLEYLPVYIQSQTPMAYVAIDHRKNSISSGQLTDFLSTILNAYIFLFLVAGALAITIANSITQPLSQLADKLKKFKLGKTNEQLEWSSNDEIGALINDYNNLTQELDKSVNLLAKTERDSAWREMAKQVAHEIKNPLTPMKLSIQYLERAHKEQPDKVGDLIPRISATLIEQIDNLSQIAGEFSNFATMPQASNEKVSLNEVVETIHDLFRKREDMDIQMNEPIDDLYVFADKNHLVRILNNLLKNAIQAIPDDKRGKIDIELKREGNEAVIRISDNGVGIPEDKKDKVFTPNFTTKSSGTGLGLAISSNMIESFNGRIYFESEENKGADFFVAIPLMKLEDYRDRSERVSLD